MGTLGYVAPERHLFANYSIWKTDVYSFARTCSHILTGLSPYEGLQLKPAKMEQFITQGVDEPGLPLNCPPTLAAFIRRCFDVDSAKRPHFREISIFLRHVKLVLMRVDDPKDFVSALTEFDREEFEQHLKPSPVEPLEAEGSFRELPLPVSDLNGTLTEEKVEISEFLSSLRSYESKEDVLSCMPNFIWQMSLKDLSRATNNFSPKNRLGKGSFATVYKGVLPSARKVAVKRLNVGTILFGTEARASAKVTHPNVIRLLGLCDEDGIKLLVYDFMIRGSLDKVLFGATAQSALNWRQRCKIALGIACGLAYLHEDCEDCILHFDVKAGNILLDLDLEPKICDFGVSELVERTSKTFISFERRGTRGYAAPELNVSLEEGKKITDRADVYSFGMLLLEMVRGRPNVQNGCCQQWTPSEARKMLEKGRLVQMMDPDLLRLPHQEVVRQQVEELLKIALQCTCEEHPDSRPPMRTVVLQLTPFTR